MSGEPTFTAFLAVHDELREMFLRHQEALLDLDFASAAALFDRHAAEIRRHIRDEETDLLPLYAPHAKQIEGGRLELYTAEHRHLKKMLRDLRRALTRLRPKSPGVRRRVIDLFDRETLYKHLLHHHDLRERNVFYPLLDRVTTPVQRLALLKRRTGSPRIRIGRPAGARDRSPSKRKRR